MMRSNGASSSPQPTKSSIDHEFRQTMIKAIESSNRTQPREKIGASNVSQPILLQIVRLKTVLRTQRHHPIAQPRGGHLSEKIADLRGRH